MDRARDILRNGAWLTRERIRLVAGAVLFTSGVGFLYCSSRPTGSSTSRDGRWERISPSFYAAGTYVLDGNPEAPYDLTRQYAREQAIFGASTPFYGWHYPPFFLFIAAMLALMPYAAALAAWQAMTLGLYLLAMRAILATSTRTASPTQSAWTSDPLWLLLALAFPAVLVNVGHGQNGFLTAALIGGALAVLDRRPIVAGILFGLLAYKPQFGLMIPVVLAASGRWRTFSSAVATVALLAAAATLVFGLERMARVPGFDALHAPRRARTGRSRLVQDAKRVRLGTHVGGANLARLRAPRRDGGRPRRRVDAGCGEAQHLTRSRPRLSVSPRSSRRHSRSTTT